MDIKSAMSHWPGSASLEESRCSRSGSEIALPRRRGSSRRARPGGAQGAAGQRSTAPPVLDLETLDGVTAERMLESGELTSVQLVQAYLARIEALNKSGPGLNAVTQINPAVMAEARRADELRAQGVVLGPAHGLPVLLKDLIDVKGMYTSNGNYSLRNPYPEDDAGIVKKLRENGVIILGKVGLSEWANSFGSQPSGFGNLTGQVLNANDADQNPSGSSSGTGAAGAAALSMLTVGTETSGSIISPSGAQSLVGIRPTVGIVPAYGIGPISSSQDTAGPRIAPSPTRRCTCSRWSAATRRTRPATPPSSGRTGRHRSSRRPSSHPTTCPRSTSTSSAASGSATTAP